MGSTTGNMNYTNFYISHFAPDQWLSGLDLNKGICIVAGPRKSGLTTTLHASAQKIENSGRKTAFICNQSDFPKNAPLTFDPATETSQKPGDKHNSTEKAFIKASNSGADVLIVDLNLPSAFKCAIQAAHNGFLVIGEIKSNYDLTEITNVIVNEYPNIIGCLERLMVQRINFDNGEAIIETTTSI